jgi:hypothetical protein
LFFLDFKSGKISSESQYYWSIPTNYLV